MKQDRRFHVTPGEAAQTAARVVISSYFIAAGSGSIEAADMGALFSPLLPEPFDRIVGGSLVMLLAAMIMLNARARLAALFLGLITFYASCLYLMKEGPQEVLGIFWRDISLIAALVLAFGGDGKQAREQLGRNAIGRAGALPGQRGDQTTTAFSIMPAGERLRDLCADGPVENIFAEDDR